MPRIYSNPALEQCFHHPPHCKTIAPCFFLFRYKIAADAVRRRSQQRQSDSDDVMSGSPTVSPIHSPTARLRISSPGRGSPGSPRTRQQHRLRANNSRNSSTRSGMYVSQYGVFTLAGSRLSFHYLCRTK